MPAIEHERIRSVELKEKNINWQSFWPSTIQTSLGTLILDLHKRSDSFNLQGMLQESFFDPIIKDDFNKVYILKGDYSGLAFIKLLQKPHNIIELEKEFSSYLSKYFDTQLGMFISFIDPTQLYPDFKMNNTEDSQRAKKKMLENFSKKHSNTHYIWAPYFLREQKINIECVLMLYKAMAGHD